LSDFSKFFDVISAARTRETTSPLGSALRPRFERDLHYESSPGVKEVLAAIYGGNPIVLIVGRAGTGKTRLVQYLKALPGGELQATVAPTGIAALNAQAQTIHSFFRFPHVVLDAGDLQRGGNFGPLYRRMKRLVIDEISMVRADLIDAMDMRLRQVRGDDRPFGGVQLVMVGDFLQLPPVVRDQDWEILDGLQYNAAYAFSAHALQSVPVTPVMLDRVWRQDDEDFVEILGRIRTGESVEDSVDQLNEKCVGPHRDGVEPLLLTATRHAAEQYNRRGLMALGAERVEFRGQVAGNFPIENANLPVPESLELAVGARVMAARNDMQGRWVNGSLGTVTRMIGDGVFVVFDRTRQEHLVSSVAWEKIKQQWNAVTQRIENEVVGTYRQIPLLHGWAVTIHKAQGLTLDDVRVDLGAGAFAPGQVYVALSRVRTLAGLSFARPLRRTDVQADPVLLAFMAWVQSGGLGKTIAADVQP
jgi:ATP-dependent exoDNAse (exonuclease V) alpha subunit